MALETSSSDIRRAGIDTHWISRSRAFDSFLACSTRARFFPRDRRLCCLTAAGRVVLAGWGPPSRARGCSRPETLASRGAGAHAIGNKAFIETVNAAGSQPSTTRRAGHPTYFRKERTEQSLRFFRLLVCFSALVFCAVFTRRLRRRTCSTRFCCTAKPAFGRRPEPRRVRTSSRL